MDERRCFEELMAALAILKAQNDAGTPIIVEGVKDRAALRSLGLTGEIISFNQGVSIPDFCCLMGERFDEVILLTDWDRTGGRLCGQISKQAKGLFRVDTGFREVCVRCCMVRVVEGLPSFLETLQQRVS